MGIMLPPSFEQHPVYKKLAETYPPFVRYMQKHEGAAFYRTLSDTVEKWDRGYSFICGGTISGGHPGVYSRKELAAAVDSILLTHSFEIIREWAKGLSKEDVTALCRMLRKNDRVQIGATPVHADRQEIMQTWEHTHEPEQIDLPHHYVKNEKVLD